MNLTGLELATLGFGIQCATITPQILINILQNVIIKFGYTHFKSSEY